MREVVAVAIAATLGNFLGGWDSSTIASGMSYIKHEFNLESDPTLEGLIVSTSFLTGTFVTIFSGTLSDMFGRRPMLITSSIMFFLSGIVMLWATNVVAVLFSRILDGVAIALIITTTPLYISEIAPPDIRGLLNTVPQFSGSSGMFVAYIMVFSMSLVESPSWRAMLGVISIPSVAYFFLAVLYLPESPPWLVSKGRIIEAKRVLQRIRGVEDVSGELALLAEGMNPGGESTTIEEYIVTPATEIISNQEAGKDCIKLYGPNQGVSMLAQPVTSGQGGSSMILTLSQQGSIFENLKDPIVNLFGSMHESNNNNLSNNNNDQIGNFGINDNLNAPLLLSRHGSISSNSNSNGGVKSNTNIGGGWQLAYKSSSGENDGGELQRVYINSSSSNAGSKSGSFVGNYAHDLENNNNNNGDVGVGVAIVSQSVLVSAKDKDSKIKPEAVFAAAAAKRAGWRGLLDPGVKRALIVGVGLQVLQQAAGINGFLYYAPQILKQAGVGALLSNLGINATSASLLVNVITTFSMLPCIAISMRLMDIAGRRSILLYTIPILIVSLLVLVLRDSFHVSSALNAAITAICVIIYESVFCMGFGVIPNILCSEIFPTSVRGICISICSLTFWISTLIITSSFPFLLHLLGLTGVFGLFVVGCIISWIFVYMKVPETKGMPLEVIIEFFAIDAKPGTDPATLGSQS